MRRVSLLLAAGTAMAALAGVTPARAEPGSETCATRVAEARFELDDLREEERVRPVHLEANAAIFALIEPLWEAHSTDRLSYLTGKHDRDRSALEVRRARTARERGESKLSVLERECGSGDEDAAAPRKQYEALGCRLVAQDREIAALDRGYWREVTAVLRELRGRELVTEQRLINASFSLARAEVELRARAQRQRACEKALAAGAAADPSPGAAPAGGGE